MTIVANELYCHFSKKKIGYILIPVDIDTVWSTDRHMDRKIGYTDLTYDKALEKLGSIEVSRTSRDSKLHYELKEKVNYVCQICGERKLGKNELDVHHIDSVWNDDPDNLLVCCVRCHPSDSESSARMGV